MLKSNIIQAGNAYIASQLKGRDSDVQRSEVKQRTTFITISREAGAGGTTVGEKLVQSINGKITDQSDKWSLFDKNLIERVIKDHNMPEFFKNFLSEEKFPEVQDTLETLMGIHPGISILASKTCRTILNLASTGRVIIIGRGANILTRNIKGGFHVRIIADAEWKINRIEKLLNMNRKDAVRYIEEEDTKRKEYVKKLFNKYVGDPLLYDIILNTSRVTPDEAVSLISSMVDINYLSLST